MASNDTTTQGAASSTPAPLPPALLDQYLEALRAGHAIPDNQKTSVDFGLLHAIASPDTYWHDKARQVLEKMPVMDRWRLGRLVDEVAAPARDLVKQRFAPFQVGMLPEDFAGTPTRDYAAGARLFAAGDEAHEAFLVETGRVLISKNGRPVAQLGRHEFFGNLPFLLPVQRTADAFAMEATQVRVLDKEAYLAKFRAFSPRRQADEWQLAYVMIRQLIAGLARYESTVKVLVDYLFPELTRHEQTEALERWMEHFTQGARLGLERLFGLFNLLEWLDRELLLLAHMDHAGAEAVQRVRSQQGILRGVAAAALRSAPVGLDVFNQPPRFLRLTETNHPWPPPDLPLLDVVCLAEFLWPEEGSRHARLSLPQAQTLKERLAPTGWIYLAAPAKSRLLAVLQEAGFHAGTIVPGLYAFSPASRPEGLPPPGASQEQPATSPSWRERLQRWFHH